MNVVPRGRQQRIVDTVQRLEHDKDMWIATASGSGVPCLVPLSFWWDGTTLYFATKPTSPTSVNVVATATARVVLGHTRDVSHMSGSARLLRSEEAEARCSEAYRKKCGWDPIATGHVFHSFDPITVEAWKELNEHSDRLVMTDGRWTTAP